VPQSVCSPYRCFGRIKSENLILRTVSRVDCQTFAGIKRIVDIHL
jgi:hypothetical protein